jgi:PHD-like zinc-binding domain
VSAGGVVEIRQIPKDCKKVKCGVCNRQQGACVRCAFAGCSTYFHPLCMERVGRGYVRTRRGEREAFCQEHVPEGVYRFHGHAIDGEEVRRIRLSLDRARLILDTLLRREKFKQRLCRVEGEYFCTYFYRGLDKAKGRKPENPDLEDPAESGTKRFFFLVDVAYCGIAEDLGLILFRFCFS